MKNKLSVVSVIAISAAFLVPAQPAQADLAISYSTGRHYRHRDYRPYAYRYDPWPYRPHYRHYPRSPSVVYTTPIVQERIVYVNQPAAPSYGSVSQEHDVAVFRERVSELRSMIHAQKDNGALPASSHERLLRSLDDLERDEHGRTYDRGGRLSSGDFAELYNRLNEASMEFSREMGRS